jgi:hypothetical protein
VRGARRESPDAHARHGPHATAHAPYVPRHARGRAGRARPRAALGGVVGCGLSVVWKERHSLTLLTIGRNS